MPGNIGAVVARRRAHNLATDAEGNHLCKLTAFALLLLASLALFATGGYYLLTQSNADTTRSELVEQYDAVVESWTDSYLQEFKEGAFSISLQHQGVQDPRPGSGGKLEARRDSTKDYIQLEEESHGDLLKYEALKYRVIYPRDNLTETEQAVAVDVSKSSHFLIVPQDWLKEPLPKAVLPRQSLVTSAEVAVEEGADEGAEADAPGAYAAPVLVDPWVETVVNVSLAVTMKNSEGADTVFSLDQVPAGLAQMTANNYKSCRQRGGVHQNAAAGHHCTIMLAASRICLVARKDDSDRWQIDMERQGNCLRTCVHPCTTRFNGTVQYTPQRSANLALEAARGRTPLEVLLRSAHDPFLTATALTNGTLNFGPSGDDVKTEGIICLVFAFVLGVPAIAHFALECADARRTKKYERYRSPVSGQEQVAVDSAIELHPYVTGSPSADGAARMRPSSPTRRS
mmetsp:Transcript_37062/g.93190  ORF Transcript_37062/g.93190 Transcript_37062/m.93190 type:complete len:457 (-) Transcript_37062:228-1598(-)